MPLFAPRPERGSTSAAYLGSPTWIAIPDGTSFESPASSVSGASRHARRSSPAAPDEPYAGMASRIRGSRIFTSSLRTSALRSRHQRRDVRDELASEVDLRRAPERMLAAV